MVAGVNRLAIDPSRRQLWAGSIRATARRRDLASTEKRVGASDLIAVTLGFAIVVWSLEGTGFAPVFSSTLAMLRWLATGLLFLGSCLLLAGPVRRGSVALAVLSTLYVGILAVSILAGEDKARSAIELSRAAAFALLPLVALHAGSGEALRWLRTAFAVAAGLVLLCAVCIVLNVNTSAATVAMGDLGRNRATGLAASPGVLGYLGAMTFAASAMSIRDGLAHGRLRLKACAMAAIAMFCILRTDSRAGEVSCLLCLALISSGMIMQVVLRSRALSLVLCLLVLAVATAALLTPVAMAMRGDRLEARAGDPKTASIAERDAVWHRAAELVESHPVLGIGFGSSFDVVLPNNHATQNFLYAHSVILNYAMMTGLPGALCMLALLGFTLWESLKAYRRTIIRPRGLLHASENGVEVVLATIVVTLTFAAIEGALQGIYTSFAFYFCAIAVLGAGPGEVPSRRFRYRSVWGRARQAAPERAASEVIATRGAVMRGEEGTGGLAGVGPGMTLHP